MGGGRAHTYTERTRVAKQTASPSKGESGSHLPSTLKPPAPQAPGQVYYVDPLEVLIHKLPGKTGHKKPTVTQHGLHLSSLPPHVLIKACFLWSSEKRP